MLWDLVDRHPFLSTYIRYNSGNESPLIYHLWAALTGVSAALGRKAYIVDGNSRIFPNIYTLLVGPPATRKSSAIAELRELVFEATRVRFAPTDIAGQKQGLLSFMAEDWISDDDNENRGRRKAKNDVDAMDAMSWLEDEVIEDNPLDRGSIFICASELMSFAGLNSSPLISALTDLYDNKPTYEYRHRRDTIVIEKPTLQMLAGATPSHLIKAWPPETNDQGLLSRIILVWAGEPRARLARKLAGEGTDRDYLLDTLHRCSCALEGPVEEDAAAAKAVDAIYFDDNATKHITDPRLMYYANRRHGVLRKLTLILALAADRQRITVDDVTLADTILRVTEEGMPDALGEYGISADARTRQMVVEYMRQQPHYITFGKLFTQMSHVCTKRSDFARILEDLVSAGKLVSLTDQYDADVGGPVVKYAAPEAMNDPDRKAELIRQLRANAPLN